MGCAVGSCLGVGSCSWVQRVLRWRAAKGRRAIAGGLPVQHAGSLRTAPAALALAEAVKWDSAGSAVPAARALGSQKPASGAPGPASGTSQGWLWGPAIAGGLLVGSRHPGNSSAEVQAAALEALGLKKTLGAWWELAGAIGCCSRPAWALRALLHGHLIETAKITPAAVPVAL